MALEALHVEFRETLSESIGDSASFVVYEQNNYQLSEERAREIDERVQRLLEDRERDDGGPAQ